MMWNGVLVQAVELADRRIISDMVLYRARSTSHILYSQSSLRSACLELDGGSAAAARLVASAPGGTSASAGTAEGEGMRSLRARADTGVLS
mmetsp:Transcript_165725/g.532119  ORF Transcript_165725/g.532119 Transcript_165725/m.532119 type:complete len:91 (+) Transcript_165725:93-365(+)